MPSPLCTCRSLLLTVALGAALSGCNLQPEPSAQELAYIRGANVEFRNELGPSSRVAGTFWSGERVEVLGQRPRWVEVRRASGETGWVQQASLVSQQVFDQFQQLARDAAALPSQGRAIVRRAANLHLTPGRDTLTFYQLAADEHVDVLQHSVVPRAVSSSAAGQSQDSEDWLLVRAENERAGWLLEGSVDLDPPLEVARYREGQRIRAWFVINKEEDDGEEHAWYLWATVRRLEGLPYDFEEIRVFVWNPRANRYETSYRERGLTGHFPIETGMRETPDGPTPTFRLHLEDRNGQRREKDYYMAGRLVRSQ